MDEIAADVQEIPMYFGAPERIFLQSADAFAAGYDTLNGVSDSQTRSERQDNRRLRAH